MDASTLAKMMLDWERLRRRLDEMEEAIRDSVLQLGKTQTVGNVRATYSAGRKQYDYEEACADYELTDEQLETYSTLKIDWRRVAFELRGLSKDEIPFSQGEPSVTVKLID